MASKFPFLGYLFAVIVLSACLQETSSLNITLSFTEVSPDVIVLKHQPLLLNCSAHSSPEYLPLSITWRHNGVTVNEPRRHVLSNGSLYFRRIIHKHKQGESDEGRYECVARNSIGILVSQAVQVTIAKLSHISMEFVSHNVSLNGVACLVCQITAIPKAHFTWQRNRENLPQNMSRYLILPSGVLHIYNVTHDDAGSYRCIATNIIGTKRSGEGILHVMPASEIPSPPKIIYGVANVTVVKVKETAILQCVAIGNPLPNIEWSRLDNKPIRTNDVSYYGFGNLKLDFVTKEDAGIYICTASNYIASTKTTHNVYTQGTLQVIVPPEFKTKPESIAKPTAQTIRFACEADGEPSPSIRWLRNGEYIKIEGRVKLRNRNEIVVSQTVLSDSGIYQCMAENVAGSISAGARLKINTSRNQPDVPVGIKGRALSSSSILLIWNESVPKNGLPIKAYTVHYLKAQGGPEKEEVAVNTSLLIEKLEANTNYTFYVRVYNSQGASEQSERITVLTGEDVPITSPSLSLSSLNSNTLIAKWEKLPKEKTRGEIIGYKIYYRRENHASMSVIEVPGDILELPITDLQPGSLYEVRIAAATSAGYPELNDKDWPWKSIKLPKEGTDNAPSPPTLHLIGINSTAIKAFWQSNNPEEAIEGYRLSFWKQNHQLHTLANFSYDTSQFLITNLEPETLYEVRIVAYNKDTIGPETIQGLATFALNAESQDDVDLIEPPRNLKATPLSSTCIQLSWKAPLSATDIIYYTVRYSPVNADSTNQIRYLRSTGLEVLIHYLQPYINYEFSARSHNSKNRQGPYSGKIECQTFEDVPSSPTNLTWLYIKQGSIRLTWNLPKHPNGVIIKYLIYCNIKSPNLPLEEWSVQTEKGSDLSIVIEELSPDTKYYFTIRAETIAGIGDKSNIITVCLHAKDPYIDNVTRIKSEAQNEPLHSPQLGVIIGVSISIIFISLCILIIVFRKRCFPPNETSNSPRPHYGNGHLPQTSGSSTKTTNIKNLPQSESHELDTFTSVLTYIPENKDLDTKGGPLITLKACKPINGLKPQLLLSSSNCVPNGQVKITTNPQVALEEELGLTFTTDDQKECCPPDLITTSKLENIQINQKEVPDDENEEEDDKEDLSVLSSETPMLQAQDVNSTPAFVANLSETQNELSSDGLSPLLTTSISNSSQNLSHKKSALSGSQTSVT